MERNEKNFKSRIEKKEKWEGEISTIAESHEFLLNSSR